MSSPRDRTEYSRRYYQVNREKILARIAARVAADPEKERARCREKERRKREADPEYARKRQSKWRGADPDRARAQSRRLRGYPEPTRPEPATCECCGRVNSGGRTLALDHDHETGEFRGWLCNLCNTAIGKLGDTLEGIERAAAYLKKTRLNG